eukprot:TRINITY_DN6152_c0_g1_i1.p2 TRINITY_DN6152_c0_g1~~TRINITY_DN6152_c0_g1_i1.p2  ORF type:complete len:113 (+),score=34.00 TRINITY_DN6152_c0_g1_i1:34-339(+)
MATESDMQKLTGWQKKKQQRPIKHWRCMQLGAAMDSLEGRADEVPLLSLMGEEEGHGGEKAAEEGCSDGGVSVDAGERERSLLQSLRELVAASETRTGSQS